MGDHITISKRSIKRVVLWLCISLPLAGLSWFAFCGKINVQAQNYVNDSINKRYPILHEPCSTKVESLEKTVKENAELSKETNASVKILVILQRRHMTYYDREALIDSLVKNEKLSYAAAYKLIDGR